VSALLSLIASLVKYFLEKLSRKRKVKEIAKDEGHNAVKDGDTSSVTGAFDELR